MSRIGCILTRTLTRCSSVVSCYNRLGNQNHMAGPSKAKHVRDQQTYSWGETDRNESTSTQKDILRGVLGSRGPQTGDHVKTHPH